MNSIRQKINSETFFQILQSANVQNLLKSIFSRIIALISSLVCSILITRSLNLDDRGQLSFILATVALFVVFTNLGIVNANIFHASKEPQNCPKLLVNSFWFALFILVVTILCMAIFQNAGFVKSFTNFELIIISISVFANLSLLLFKNILIGDNKISKVNIVESVIKSFSLVAIVILYILHKIDLHICIEYYLLEPLLTIAVFTFVQREWIVNLRFDFPYFKYNLKYGVRIYILGLLGFLVMKADVFFIKRFLDNKQLGIYATSALVVENLGFIASVMSTLLLPRLIRIEGVRERFLVSRSQTFIASVVLFIIYSVAFVFAEFILSIFIKSNAILGVNVFRLLLVANFFLSVQSVNVQFLNSIGVPSRLIIYWFIASLSNIVLNFFFIQKYGIEGAAIFSVVSYFIIYILVFFENKYQLKLHHDKN